MSIYDLPPQATTVAERLSGRVRTALSNRLADESISRTISPSTEVATISYLPTYDSIQHRIGYLTMALAEITARLDELASRLQLIATERAALAEKMRLEDEVDDDLRLVGRRRKVDTKTHLSITAKALDDAWMSVTSEREAVLEECANALAELEKAQDKEFELLQQQ